VIVNGRLEGGSQVFISAQNGWGGGTLGHSPFVKRVDGPLP
jgi:hypothetical protein